MTGEQTRPRRGYNADVYRERDFIGAIVAGAVAAVLVGLVGWLVRAIL